MRTFIDEIHVKLKGCLRLLSMESIRLFTRMLSIFPIRPRRILFQSYGAATGYTCNPKYICEYLKEHFPGKYELVWAFADPERFHDIQGICSVRHKSLKWFLYMVTSKVIVINEGPPAYIAKRKGQYVIQTWHGGGAYKKVGFARDGFANLSKITFQRGAKAIDLFLAASRESARTCAGETYHYTGEVLNSGTPRNDLFFDAKTREETSRLVRERLGIKGYVVLYAPTFRREGENLHKLFSFQKLRSALESRFGSKIVFLIRSHRYNDGEYQADTRILDVSDYPDMQELLCAADMLITDYSSSIWDFALLERPCLLYVPDLKEYGSGDRGFFTPIEEWPGLICETPEALYRTVGTLDEKVCAEKAAAHLKALGSYEVGTAAQQVCERILQIAK